MASSLALQACALLFPPFPHFRRQGLKVDDELDEVFSKSFSCQNQYGLKLFRDAGLRADRCSIIANVFSRVILEKSKTGISARDYLRSRGGRCTELSRDTWRCVVAREVTSGAYVGDEPSGPTIRTIFTLTVEIRERDGSIQSDIDRYDHFPPSEKRGRRAD
jgi:hypothetical protein